MRRADRQLQSIDAIEILNKCEYGILSVVDEMGMPYGLPMSYVYDEGKLYFHHTNDGGQLGSIIADDTKACFTIVGDTELLAKQFSTRYESVIATGTIRRCSDKLDGLMRLVRGLTPDYIEKGEKYAKADMDKVDVYVMRVDTLSGKARRN